MDIFAEPSKGSASLSSIKKIQFIQSTDGTNFLIQQIIFPVIKKNPDFPQTFLFNKGLLEFPVFQSNCDGLNPYSSWSGLVVGLMGAS